MSQIGVHSLSLKIQVSAVRSAPGHISKYITPPGLRTLRGFSFDRPYHCYFILVVVLSPIRRKKIGGGDLQILA